MPFQGGRAAVLCIAVCRTSTPSGRAGGHGPRCFWARHPEPAPTAHPDFMPAAAMLRAPRLLAAGLPRQDARCLPFQNCLLCSNQSPRAASNPVAPSLKLAAGNAAAIARFQPVRRPPTPRPARPSSVQLRGIRISQVCLLLQKVHPPLEELAAPGVAHCQPHARSPQCKGARLPTDRLRVSDHAEVPLRASHGHYFASAHVQRSAPCSCFSLPRSSSSGTRRELTIEPPLFAQEPDLVLRVAAHQADDHRLFLAALESVHAA